MRIRRIDLLRYGRFTNVSVELPVCNPDLHIVFGGNEAGKSTALSAIEDALFGIPHNSPFNFLHDYSSMRIGVVLENDDETLEVRRRKGNKDTLLTLEELPVPAGESALAPFLAGADRAFFERMFSLDHERLREGGREILDAQDEIGQVLFSASAGLSGLRETLRDLTEEADGLWAPRRAARRKFFQAEARLKEATTTLRDHTVTATKWTQLRRASDAAQDSYATLEKEIQQASAEQRKLARIRRVFRNVRRQTELKEGITEIGNARQLPKDALSALESAERDESTATARVETMTAQLEIAQEDLSELSYDEDLIVHEQDIEHLHERRIKVRDGRADLPKRRAELARAEADLGRLAAELGWNQDDIDSLIGRIPDRAKISTVRTLLNQRGEHLSAVENAESAAEEATAKVAELRRKQEAQAEPPDMSRLAAVTRATRSIGDIASRLNSKTVEFEEAQTDSQRLVELLRPSIEDANSLGALCVPPRTTVQEHRDSLRTLNQRIQLCRERNQTAERELNRHNKAYKRLTRDEPAIAPADLAQARERRDAGWSLIRRRFVAGATLTEAEIAPFGCTEHQLADAFEAAVHSADELADLRFDNAEAAAQLAMTSRQIEEQEELLCSHLEETETLEVGLRTLDIKWQEMWSNVPFEPLTPDEMLEWLTTRSEALDAIERQKAAERQMADLRRQDADARNRMLDELATANTNIDALVDQPLAVVVEYAADVLRENAKASEARCQLDDTLSQATTDAERKQKALREAEKEWSEWKSRWAKALAALGLDLAATAEVIAAQVDTIDEMRTSAQEMNDLRRERIGKIERDVTEFSKDVNQLVATVAPDLAEVEPEEIVLQLEQRLANARRLRDLQTEKTETIASLELAIESHKAERRNAREIIGGLQDAAGVSGKDQLKVAIEKSDRLRSLRLAQEEILDALRSEGDGLSVAELEEECDGVDFDQVSAREESISQNLSEMRERLLEAREHRAEARQAFEAIGGNDSAARAEAVRQEALAEMQEVAEQYIRVRVSALLLQWAIDRYRREKQAPLLRRTGQLFSTLTSGSFSSLRVDFDDQDNAHLIGMRPNGTAVPVPGMSTGTADQLYFALRIASISDYLDRASPLPFVADDLFVNYDDERAAAGFRMLAQLGAVTQVLFFTHHWHLVKIAQSALGEGVAVVPLANELDGG